jgi:hypothetical protein
MPIDYATQCGCDGCQSNLTYEERVQYQRYVQLEEARVEAERSERARQRSVQRAAEEARQAEPVQCSQCGEEHPRRENLHMGTNLVCENCAVRCEACASGVLRDLAVTISRSWGSDATVCEECVRECYECGDQHVRDEMHYVNGDWYCDSCSRYCDHCEERYIGECESDSCRNRIRGLSAYGKTHASRWLGGPVRQQERAMDKGYYLGFELEISADTGEVQPVYDWARENLGYQDALDCKEDSSVEGFEIATQPMTPAFFESVKWESLFEMLNERFPLDSYQGGKEPVAHGLHVHIGRVAFDKDDIAMAAFCYLLNQGNHLERIARREPTSYCAKVKKPVSSAIKQANIQYGKHQRQASKPYMRDVYLGRDAINLNNGPTIEIRAFRSTRSADELRDAVRLVYVAAEYIRSLRAGKGNVSPKALHWVSFSTWVGVNHPEAFASIAGITDKKIVKG